MYDRVIRNTANDMHMTNIIMWDNSNSLRIDNYEYKRDRIKYYALANRKRLIIRYYSLIRLNIGF